MTLDVAAGLSIPRPPEGKPDLLVETHSLTKRYGSRVIAVDNVSMTIRRGEVYGLLGPNGAGKTTTLRILLGLIRPTSGTASVLGSAPGSPQGLAQVGALVESPAFYPYLSGRENLRVMADYIGANGTQIEDALARVDLLDRARDPFRTYSLGMKQRLGVAATLLKDPALLILDEPTNGLDPRGIAEMRELIRDVGQGERSVLISSHLLGEVEQMCDRVGVIQRGRLIAEGTLAELRGPGALLVRAEPLAEAQQIVADLSAVQRVQMDGGALHVTIDPRHAAELNRHLVSAGIAVSELRLMHHSLEEVFFALTEE